MSENQQKISIIQDIYQSIKSYLSKHVYDVHPGIIMICVIVFMLLFMLLSGLIMSMPSKNEDFQELEEKATLCRLVTDPKLKDQCEKEVNAAILNAVN